jgi:hypothetical protein
MDHVTCQGVTYSCYYQSHQLCEGTRMRGGIAVGECRCRCHDKDGKP